MKKLLLLGSALLVSTSLSAKTPDFMNGMYITGGLNYSLTDTKFKTKSWTEEDGNTYNQDDVMAKNIQGADFLPNIGIGYNINNFLAVELNYKRGMPLNTTAPNVVTWDEEPDGTVYPDEVIAKSYKNSSNSYIAYVVGKYQVSNFTPFVKLGLGYSNYKTSARLTEMGSFGIDQAKIVTEAKGLSYHVQLGSEYNINKNNAISFYYGADVLMTKPKTTINDTSYDNYDGSISSETTKQTEKKHTVFDNTIGVNYTYTFNNK